MRGSKEDNAKNHLKKPQNTYKQRHYKKSRPNRKKLVGSGRVLINNKIMKTSSKEKILYWGVKPQIQNRPNKNARGMAFTNERRARINNKSTFYHAIITNNKCTQECRTLAVRGTLDRLASFNSVSKYNIRRFNRGLPQQKKGKNSYTYLKEVVF